MASPLAEAHIEAERRLRELIRGGVGHAWRELPGYDERNVDQWLSRVIPLVLTGQRTSVSLTNAYLARAMGRQPLGIDQDALIGRLRPGVTPEEQWHRPFVTLWSKLGDSVPFATASSAALARAQSMAAFDVQSAMAATAQTVGEADPQIQRYQRVADGGACEFCQEVDGAILNSDDAMPLHNNCGCSVEPLTEARPVTPAPPTVAVQEHGEMGLLLADPAHDFTEL